MKEELSSSGLLPRSQGWPLGWIGASIGVIAALGVILSLSGCNLYGGIDNPSGDAQIISRARADLDAADYNDAIQEYAQLSSANSDIKYAESAYSTFANAGAGMQGFAAGFGDGSNANIGAGLTSIANQILQRGAGTSVRQSIYNAFANYQNITDNQDLSSLVRFLGATAFASEILAEIAKNEGASTVTTAVVNSNTTITCSAGNSSDTLVQESSNISSGDGYDLFNAALLDIEDGIEGLAGSGSFTSSFNSAFSLITGHGVSLGYGCSAIGTSNYNTLLTGAFPTSGLGVGS